MRLAVITPAVLVLLALAAPVAAQPAPDFGSVSVTVRPATADVFVDGERWVSSDPSRPLVVQLAAGRHAIDVRAPGYRPFSTVVEFVRGESTPLNVSLLGGLHPAAVRGAAPPPPGEPGPIRQVSVSRASGDGFVFAPDFKIAQLNHRTTGFAGFYGGAVFAGRVMIGGGAYFQLDDYPSEQMAYGGLVAEYPSLPRSSRRRHAARPRRVRRHERSDLRYHSGSNTAITAAAGTATTTTAVPTMASSSASPRYESPRISATACGSWAESGTGSRRQTSTS